LLEAQKVYFCFFVISLLPSQAGRCKISGSSNRQVAVATYMGLEELDAYIYAFDHIEKVCLEDE
jgi:hypothetical protein